MAASQTVNLSIGAGVEFYQEFTLTLPDFTPKDLLGSLVSAAISKHGKSLDVINSQSGSLARKLIHFVTNIVDSDEGTISIYLSPAVTSQLEEGKYLYSVVVESPQSYKIEAVSGIVFVDEAFGDAQPEAPSNELPEVPDVSPANN